MPMVQSFRSFPYDIEREIFEIAARKERATALELSLISSRVHSWRAFGEMRIDLCTHFFIRRIEQILFESLQFSAAGPTREATKLLLKNLERKSPEFRACTVKTIFIHDGTLSFTINILSLCKGINNLVCNAPLPASVFSSHIRLSRLATAFSNIVMPDEDRLDISVLANITHLEIFDAFQQHTDFPDSLKMLPRLTHLALNYSPEQCDMQTSHLMLLLEAQLQLQMLVTLIHIDPGSDSNGGSEVEDSLRKMEGGGILTFHGQGVPEDWRDWMNGEEIWTRTWSPLQL